MRVAFVLYSSFQFRGCIQSFMTSYSHCFKLKLLIKLGSRTLELIIFKRVFVYELIRSTLANRLGALIYTRWVQRHVRATNHSIIILVVEINIISSSRK